MHKSVVDEEYIEELKDKSENKNTRKRKVLEERFQKVGGMKETSKQIKKNTRAMFSNEHCRSFIH